jgi:peroxiredoxin family protein/TusA-related sulfurtransferase
MASTTPDHVLDVVGLKCPMPVLKTKIQFKKMNEGETVEVITDDPGSRKDLPAWADKTGNLVIHSGENGDGTFHFLLQKPSGNGDQVAEEKPAANEAPGRAKKRSMLLVVSKGTLDMAYPPLILATTAASMDVSVKLFFTFYGIDIINRKKTLKVAPIANPAMPMPVPNMIGALPGMTNLATGAMKSMMRKGNVPPVEELLKTATDMGVELLACQMTMDVMGVEREDLIEEVTDTVGAAAFVADALDAEISMFI